MSADRALQAAEASPEVSAPIGLKQCELQACRLCGKSPFAGGPTFHRITIERFVANVPAVQRAAGLVAMLGSAKLAEAMGPDEDLAHTLPELRQVALICQPCALDHDRGALFRLTERLEKGAG